MGKKVKRNHKQQPSARQIRNQVASMAIYIFLAWLKDENYIDNDAEKLLAIYRQLEGYFEAVNSHLISVETIKGIIEKDTGLIAEVH